MNRSIILERPLIVRCWRVIGQVAKAEKRTELIPVLLRVRETGGTDARDLAEHLLFESRSRRVVAERLLHIAHAYGLVEKEEHDRVFTLTEAGERAIDTDEVFVPDLGAWTIWASDDPLLPSPILRVEAWNEPRAFDEIKGKKRKSSEERSHEALPAWLQKVVNKPITPNVGAAAICINHLEDKAEAVETNGTLRLSWNVGDGRLQLTGALEGKKVATELEAPPLSLDQIWFTLFEQEALLEEKKVATELEASPLSLNQIWPTLLEQEALIEWWDMDRQKLCVSFDGTDDTEREAMVRDLRFESPHIPDYGEFDLITVREVPITPATEADVQSWAKWRLRTRIQDYATSERYAAWRAEAADPFDQYEVELPTRTQIARELWNQTTNRPKPEVWHLAAAEDWRL